MANIIPLHGGESLTAKETGNANAASYEYLLSGYDSDVLAMAAIDAYKGPTATVRGAVLVFDQIQLKHVECDIYRATVSYVDPEKQEQQDNSDESPQWTFSVTGETIHVTRGKAVRQAFPLGAQPDTFGGAINVEKDSKGKWKIKGIDVEEPLLGITIDFKIPQPLDPPALARQLARSAKKTNKTVWYGFQPTEVLFKGARVSGKRREKWSMQYEFAASENVVIDVGGAVGACTKRGFDYFWVYYTPKIGPDEQVVPDPTYAFSHMMYDEFEFRDLGLGG